MRLTSLILRDLPYRDSPEAAGYPPVEDPAARAKAEKEKADKKKAAEGVDPIKILVESVLKNPYIWGRWLVPGAQRPSRERGTRRSCLLRIPRAGSVPASCLALTPCPRPPPLPVQEWPSPTSSCTWSGRE